MSHSIIEINNENDSENSVFGLTGNTDNEFQLQKTGYADSFCSVTISWKNVVLRYFQTFSCLFTAICLFLAPFEYFFAENYTISRITTVADMVYLLVMLFRSRTSLMKDGVEETDLLNVRDRYQGSIAFVLDLITYFPLIQLRLPNVRDSDGFYILNRQTMFVRLHYILYYLNLREQESGTSTLLYRTTRYILLSSLVIHYSACGWYGLACSRNEQLDFTLRQCNKKSWIVFLPQNIIQKVLKATNGTDRGAIRHVSFLDNTYITSLYWSAATVTSTGYGDVRAYTIPEKIFSIFIMVIGLSVLYGMTMGGMTSMLTNIDAARAVFVHRYKAFEKEVNRMGVSKEVKELCLHYFDYLWRRWKGEDVYATGFLNILPLTHKASFAYERFKPMFKKMDLLAGTEEAFVRNLAMNATVKFYLKGQFLQKSGEICESVNYVHRGILEVMDDDEENVVAIIHPGKVLGQAMLFYELPRINSIRCKTNCDIFFLTKEDFRNILALYPDSASIVLNAVQEKCSEQEKLWPMTQIDVNFYNKSLRNAETVKRLKYCITGNASISSLLQQHKIIRRITTIYANNYNGFGLSRIPVTPSKLVSSVNSSINVTDRKPSLIEFVHEDNLKTDDLDDHEESEHIIDEEVGWKERLAELTVINPDGPIFRLWLDSMFFVGLLAGLYTSYAAFFTTTPGQQSVYTYSGNDDLFGKTILDMATDTCNFTQNEIYYKCPPWPFNATVECIRDAGGPFAWRVTGNSSDDYQVRLPARYDISRSAYSGTTESSQIHSLIAFVIIDVPCILNIIIQFRTGVLAEKGLDKNFKAIFSNYNRWNKLWLDILSIFPFALLASAFECTRLSYIQSFAFLRLNRVIVFFKYVPTAFTRWEYSLNVKITRIRTFKFLVYIYSITHMCACCFYFWSCGYPSQRYVDNIIYKCHFGSWAWVYDIDYFTSDTQDYIKTMYWATTTMTSTGYGDITASTTPGRIFALSTMIVGTIMYGWLVAVIASTISNNETAIVKFRIAMLDLKKYLTIHEVPNSMIRRVLNVRQLEWQHYEGTAVPGQAKIGQELSDGLQSSLSYESLNQFIECLPFFHGLNPSFVALLCKQALIYHFTEGDIILYEGDLSKVLYIIKRGHCNVVTADLQTKLEHLAPGDYFGECELLFGCGSPRTIAAETACEVVVITRNSLESVLESFPIIKDQLSSVNKDEKYIDRVLQAIKLKNVGYSDAERGSMKKKYGTEYIEEDLKIYTERIQLSSGVIFLSKDDQDIRLGFLGKLFYVFLMPLSFDPLSKSNVVYESIRACLILLTLVIVPLQFAFMPAHYPLLVMQYTLDLLSMVDIYIKAHTAYFNHRAVLVTHPIRTALHYIRTSFMVDFLSWFPFEVIIFARLHGVVIEQQWRLLAILRVNRILQMYKVHGYFSYWLSKIRDINRWIIHLRNVMYGILLHHWIACIMFVLACPPVTSNIEEVFVKTHQLVPLTANGLRTYCLNTTWIGNIAFTDAFPSIDIIGSVIDQYIVSFYWGTATLVSVGYGDIHAYQPVEMLVATFIMISGTVFYSFILGGMSASVQTDDIRRGIYREKISDIKKFFLVYNINKYTEDQVLNYYYYLWERTGGVSPEKLFVGLPPSIRTSVCQCMYGPMIREAFGEEEEFDKELGGFFRLLSTHISPYLYLKGSIICRRNDIGNEMFFIQRGLVAILDEDEATVIKVLGPGQHFGEVALLFTVPRSKTIKAVTNCELNILSKNSLDSILDHFPQYRQKMISVAEDRKQHEEDSTMYTADLTGYNISVEGFSKKKDNDAQEAQKNKKFVIHRDSAFLAAWHNIVVVLSFLSACLCIYQVSYFNHNIILYLIGYFIDTLFLFDMVIAFNTSVVDQFSGNVDDPKRVNMSYAKTLDRFLLDAISNAPTEAVAFFLSSNRNSRLFLFGCGRLNRLLRLYRMFRIFHDWERDIRLNAFAVRLYYALMVLSFTIHCTACMWYALACPNGVCADPSWTTVLDNAYFDNRVSGYHLLPWIDSLYWTVATMTSTGYGDIKPETKAEMLFASYVMVLGKIMIGYILGITAATLANDESLTVWYKQNVNAVKRCMTDHNFEKKKFLHIVQYYEYLWMKNQGVNTLTLFLDLSFSLRADIASQVCGSMVQSMELFKGCPDNFLRHVCMAMIPSPYMPGDYICYEGDVNAQMYTIYRGFAVAERLIDGEKVQFQEVKEGENFLCESLLAQVRRPCSLVARTYVDAFTMTMDGLLNILQFHPLVTDIIVSNAKKMYPELGL